MFKGIKKEDGRSAAVLRVGLRFSCKQEVGNAAAGNRTARYRLFPPRSVRHPVDPDHLAQAIQAPTYLRWVLPGVKCGKRINLAFYGTDFDMEADSAVSQAASAWKLEESLYNQRIRALLALPGRIRALARVKTPAVGQTQGPAARKRSSRPWRWT
jgi:hypothetical protein